MTFTHASVENTKFVFISSSEGALRDSDNTNKFNLPLGKSEIKYGYYTSKDVMVTVTYKFIVVDLRLDSSIEDKYSNTHSLDVSELVSDAELYGYSVAYTLEMFKVNGETSTLDNTFNFYSAGTAGSKSQPVYFDGTHIIFKNDFDGLYTIKITGKLIDVDTSKDVITLTNIKFDNKIYDNVLLLLI